MTDEEIRNKFMLAIKALYNNDLIMIKNRCCERSIVFRLGVYLNQIFEELEFNTDCEYNKKGDSPKSLLNKKYNFPDLIIHKRCQNRNNLLIIEVKTPNDTKLCHFKNDKKKLEAFTQEVEYKYCLGAHVYISTTKCSLVWYKKGEIIDHELYRVIDHGNLQKVDLNSTKISVFDRWYRNKECSISKVNARFER